MDPPPLKRKRKKNLNILADFTDADYFLLRDEIPHTTNYSPLLGLISQLDGKVSE